jgi:hypothetical protein
LISPLSLSTHFGSMRRFTSSGTASPKMACLSAIDEELSIMNKRSILFTLFCFTCSITRAVTCGVAGATGRSRQPLPTMETGVIRREPTAAARMARTHLLFEDCVRKRNDDVGNGETRMQDQSP